MNSHSFSPTEAMVFYAASLLALLQVVATGQVASPVQDAPAFCSFNATLKCYSRSIPEIEIRIDEHGNGSINYEKYAEVCTKLTLPSECHGQLALCPEEVKTNLSSFEEGYRLTRDVICDRRALEDAFKLLTCLNRSMMGACIRTHLPGDPDLDDDYCRVIQAHSRCIDETFRESCPPEHEPSKATLKKLSSARLLLYGCERSSQGNVMSRSPQGSVVPQGFMVGVVVTILFLHGKLV